jgi:hypothetical protein
MTVSHGDGRKWLLGQRKVRCVVQKGDVIPFGRYGWVVLECAVGSVLIMTEDVVERGCVYHHERAGVTWEGCFLRGYLNDEFYRRFTEADRTRIQEMEVANNANPWFGTDGGKNTRDRIFLLSIEEVVRYFGDSGQLCEGNPQSKLFINDRYKAKRVARCNGRSTQWWLRSPGLRGNTAADVFAGGAIHVSGHRVDNTCTGFRPALWLSLL